MLNILWVDKTICLIRSYEIVCNIFFHTEVSADILFLSMLRLRFNKDFAMLNFLCYFVLVTTSRINYYFLPQLSVKELCANYFIKFFHQDSTERTVGSISIFILDTNMLYIYIIYYIIYIFF